MNTAKFVFNLVKTDGKFQCLLAAIVLLCSSTLIELFRNSLGWETNTIHLIATGLSGTGCLIFVLVKENVKFFLFMSGFFSALFLVYFVKILGCN